MPVRLRDGQAGYGGIITCGLIWSCPVCSASLRQRRAQLVEDRARRWLAAGHGLLFVTLTRAHTMADDLGPLLDSVTDTWRAVQQSRHFRSAAVLAGYVGPLRATEITHGYNGWHPHLHLLLWLEKPLTDAQCVAFEDAIAHCWLGGVDASREHGVRAVRVGRRQRDADALSAYLVKMQDGYDDGKPASKWSAAQEMTRGDLKRGRSKHRTPFQIAEAAGMGDKRATALWRVYESATKGRRCIQWGQKLSARLVDDQSDEQLLGGVESGVVVLELARSEWNLVRGYHADGRLLDAVERGGILAGVEVIRACFARATFDHARGRPPRGAPPAAGVVGERVDGVQQVG